ncbi:SMP-30/gluconolactonase/LRE family protein [Kitasatospora sp. NPDC090308]|uniref:SMP-30/gluconolactonase/LRE family protein n=1 Tax=Kitasatospora sp. NPDC090308 TaxID=3364082 RepID=UPI003803F9AD
MREDHWRPIGPARHQLAEAARWHDGRLYYTDLLRGTLHAWDPARPGRVRTPADLGVPLGAVAPVAGRAGEWIAAAGDGIVRLGPTGPVRWLARPEAGADRPRRMNDAGCDPAGRFWATSMAADAAEGAGSLYRVDTDGGVHRVLAGLTVPNGPVFAPDGTVLYLADSARGEITAHALDPATGELGRSRTLVRLPAAQGRPDGMAVDARGRLWVAAWGAGTVRCHAPDGRLLGASAVGTPHVSSVAFGGGLMFATTARHRLPEPDALAGAVLARRSEVAAPPAAAYREEAGTRNGNTAAAAMDRISYIAYGNSHKPPPAGGRTP